jgi:hypothetical protein
MRIYNVLLICVIFLLIFIIISSCNVQNRDIQGSNQNTVSPNLSPSVTFLPTPVPSSSVMPTLISPNPSSEVNPLLISPQPAITASSDQQQIVDRVVSDLKLQGINILSTRFLYFPHGDPDIELEFTLQSTSHDSKSSIEDGFNRFYVKRAANLAQLKGLNIAVIGIVLVNQQGQQISTEGGRVSKISVSNTPSSLNDATLSDMLKQQISPPAPSTVNNKVFKGYFDLREVNFDIQVPDLQTANSNIGIVSKFTGVVNNLNRSQDAQISLFRINITDSSGNPLLKLIDDLVTGATTWWETPGLVNWGYPSPLPVDPRLFRLQITSTFSKPSYMSGDLIDAKINFTNNDSEPGIINPFPPGIDILMPSLPQTTIQSFGAGKEAVTLNPGETRTYDFQWDQKKSNGEKAGPGLYQLFIVPTGQKASQPGTPIKLSQYSPGFTIQYSQGDLNKVIEVNQTKTKSGLHIKWGDYNRTYSGFFVGYGPGFDYVVDVSMTLQKIEFTDQGTSIFVMVNCPNLPPVDPKIVSKYEIPWFATLPPATYGFDGIFKNAGTPGGKYLDSGVIWQWGYPSRFLLDPIPSDAREFVFRIPQYGEWQGPWEFTVPLR